MNDRLTILNGDALEMLATLPDQSVQCCVTSPPYWGLRDYGVTGQLGLEKTPEEYVSKMVAVFREVRRVLKDDGTCWINLGDSYASSTKGSGGPDSSSTLVGTKAEHNGQRMNAIRLKHGVKEKDLCRHSVDGGVRVAGGWLVSTARHHLGEAEPDARKRA